MPQTPHADIGAGLLFSKTQRIYASANMNATGDGQLLFPPVPAGKWMLLLLSFTPILPNAADTWTIGTQAGVVLVSLAAADTFFDFGPGILYFGGEQITLTIVGSYASGTQVNAVAQIVPLVDAP